MGGQMSGRIDSTARSAVIWQGYHHEWEYNHRLNRFGSYVAQRRGPGETVRTLVGHTAASGTGGDSAHFCEYVTKVHSAKGVAFQAGSGETVVECWRGSLTSLLIEVDDLDLLPELQGRDRYAVVLNGFDLCALEHAEKLMAFDVDVTEPAVYAGGTKARFYIVGRLRFDCRSPECPFLPFRLGSEAVHEGSKEDPDEAGESVLPAPRPRRGPEGRRFDRIVRWLKRLLTTTVGVREVKRFLLRKDPGSTRHRLFRAFGRRFYLRRLKRAFSAPYRVRVHFLLIGGDRDALAVRDAGAFEHTYCWDLEHEIHREQAGVLPVSIKADDVAAYAVNTLAFRRMSIETALDRERHIGDPTQWGRGMHLLEWSMAIRDIEVVRDGVCAKLDLFYKCWSEAMDRVITWTTWGAVRGAGSARIGARLALLQFKQAATDGQRVLPGRIDWPGGGRSAQNDGRARFERTVRTSPEGQ
jgi:hypothetical protein